MGTFRLRYPNGRVFGYHDDKITVMGIANRFGLIAERYLFGQWVEVQPVTAEAAQRA